MIVRVVGSAENRNPVARPTLRACSQRAKPVTACVNAAQVRVASAQASAILSAFRACPVDDVRKEDAGDVETGLAMPPLRPIAGPEG